MPLNISVTKRQVKNATGIDISVTGYDPASTARQVKDYHVVVITKLPFFKRPEHSEDDVVQFMVPRDYSSFEKLQKDILFAFPELNLPSFPKKFHVFMSEADIEERQISFDCIIKLIAKDHEMCTSSPLLQFLGFSLVADRNYFKARRQYLQKKEEEASHMKKKDESVFGSRSAEIEHGLFGEESNERTEELFEDDSHTKGKTFTADSIFDDESRSGRSPKKSAKISLLDENKEDDLFITKQSDSEVKTRGGSGLFDTEDNSELLNVSETLDDVLQIANNKPKKVPAKKVAPSRSGRTEAGQGKSPRQVGGGLFDVDDQAESGEILDMGTDDIMKYIQQNQSQAADDNLDLF